MQSVDCSVCTASFDCDDLVLPHGSLRPADLFDKDSSLPYFIFTPTGSITCAYSPRRLHCQFTNGKQFSWSPSTPNSLFSLENWPTDSIQSWSITGAAFLPSATGMVVLLSPPHGVRPQRSLLCILDLNDGNSIKFSRFISLRGRAEVVCVIAIDQQSITFDGMAAVAFEGGLLTLLDLCIGWKLDKSCVEPSACVSIEQCLEAFSNGDLISPFSQLLEHSLVNLNSSRISLNNFYYQTPRDETVTKVPCASTKVTLLHHVPQMKALVVGFSFGGWQLWSLTKLKLVYTYRELPSLPVATVSCAFSEPSDDPRYCCYLWIGWQAFGRSSHESSSSSVFPKVGLFQLGFRKRIEHTQPNTEDALYEYEEFYGASKRLSAPLTPIPNGTSHASESGAILTSIQPLGTNYSANYGLRSNRLTALVWRAAPQIVRIGLFDLDRWYHAQMPSTIRSDNSFFAVYDASLNFARAYPLTVHILPHTIIAFWADAYRRELNALKLCGDITAVKKSLRKPLSEYQLRPSTHAFKALVPFIKDLAVACACLKFISRQELALRDISTATASPSSSFDPIDWITEAVACGLIQEFDDSDCDITRTLKEAENSEWGTRQAIGLETLPLDLLKQIEIMDEEEMKGNAGFLESVAISIPPRKDGSREILADHGSSRRLSKRSRRDRQLHTPKYLPPTWVIIANCLFEHGLFEETKALASLVAANTARALNNDFNARAFMRRWLWLLWLGKKSYLEILLSPVFGVDESASPVTVEGLRDLSLCIQSLRLIADIAKVVMSVDLSDEEAVSTEAKLKLILTLAEYTRSVCLLLRLGLLPQALGNANQLRSSSKTPLLPYSYTEINDFLSKLLSARGALSVPPTAPFITNCIMAHLRHLITMTGFNGEVVETEVAISYPPHRLQSICALWQCFEPSPQPSPAHLALLVFLLFDIVAVNALHSKNELRNESNSGTEDKLVDSGRRVRLATDTELNKKTPWSSQLGPVARAVRLQQFVASQVVGEFPDFEKYISTVRTLWLIDRFRFPEVLCSRLSPVATGQVTSLSNLPEIFPDQAKLVAEYCLRYGETELAALFTPPFNSASFPMQGDNVWANGSVLPALYHARRLYFKQNDREAAAKVLLEVADKFRKSGRFLDFINLGLTAWEADIVFSDMHRRGDNQLLFACLVARAQYKEAQDLLIEVDADVVSRLSQRYPQRLSRTPAVHALASTISSCLPHLKYLLPFSTLINTDNFNDKTIAFDGSDSIEENVNNRTRVACVELNSAFSLPHSSDEYLPRHFMTPKGRNLSIRPCTVDKNRASEFWNHYDMTQRVLRGENPYESRSPVKAMVTDSARKLSRKLRQTLYRASVVSPLPMMRKQNPVTSRDPPDANSSVSEGTSFRSRSDFWSELGRIHEGELRKRPKAPTASILKVRSAPPHECAQTPSLIAVSHTEDDREEGTPSILVDEDDAEVTINPHTLQLDRKISLSKTNSEPASVFPSAEFIFSPPNRTTFARPEKMDEVAEALCSATRFTFASPTTYLMTKFPIPNSAVGFPIEEMEEEDASAPEISYRLNLTPGAESFYFADESQMAVNIDNIDYETESTAADEEDASTQTGTEDDEQEGFESQTPRRSKRNAKRPQRYRF